MENETTQAIPQGGTNEQPVNPSAGSEGQVPGAVSDGAAVSGQGGGTGQQLDQKPVVAPDSAGDHDGGQAQEQVLTIPEGFPPQVLEFAKSQGLSQAQLDASLTFFGQVAQASTNVQQQQLRQLGEAHVQQWGEQGQYNLSVGRRALKLIDSQGVLTQMLNETGYGNHPAVLQSLYELGVKLQEGGFISPTQARQPGKLTAAQAMYGETHPSKEI